ncbi:DUF2889 domain-containing protein [Nitrogeniibacter mangrovi]|uniref:DUF2889 domain-containing protein n=1 Tax=Nitrogeniibacter mangrovi TaxID=2016596 RepID=A0A6C1B5P7_9RHOO|nr:DUF2889 domain-containing protein [Nitrogeniibacter mangrovi]QID18763.1 DUF2889 domain-containing protein [Nitrogeniibacter mangrovi]
MADNQDGETRQRIHTRSIDVTGYLRDDGLFDIEARLVDAKGIDYPLSTGLRRAGEPVHDMRVCLTVDRQLTIHAVEARMGAMPYPGACDEIVPDYQGLVGLNLMHGFRRALREQLGGVAGCSHLSELLMSVPTAAIQTLASFVTDNQETRRKPFQLDRCHALDTRGETVRHHYPRWYRK